MPRNSPVSRHRLRQATLAFVVTALVPTASWAQIEDPTDETEDIVVREGVLEWGRLQLEQLGIEPDGPIADRFLAGLGDDPLAMAVLPEVAPAEGIEWAHLAQSFTNGDARIDLGTATWRLDEGQDGAVMEAVAVFPQWDITATMTLRPGPGDRFFDPFEVEVEIEPPGVFGALRGRHLLSVADRNLLTAIELWGSSEVEGNTISVSLPLSYGIRATLADLEAIMLSFRTTDRSSVVLSIGLGETGHAVLEQANARWAESDTGWLQLSGAVPIPGVAPPTDAPENAYLFQTAPDGTVYRFDAIAEWSLRMTGPDIQVAFTAPTQGLQVRVAFAPESMLGTIPELRIREMNEQRPPTIEFGRLRLKPTASGDGDLLVGEWRRPETLPTSSFFLWPTPDAVDRNRFLLGNSEWFELEFTNLNGDRGALVFPAGDAGRALIDQWLLSWGPE